MFQLFPIRQHCYPNRFDLSSYLRLLFKAAYRHYLGLASTGLLEIPPVYPFRQKYKGSPYISMTSGNLFLQDLVFKTAVLSNILQFYLTS